MNTVTSSRVIKIEKNSFNVKSDLLAIEEPLEIRLGFSSMDNREQCNLSVTMRTPGHDFELALGFLFTEGIIQSYAQVETIHYCENVREDEKENVIRVELKPDVVFDLKKLQRNFYTTSSCGVCGKTSIETVQTICSTKLQDVFQVGFDLIHMLPGKLRNHQTVFEHTGSLHAVALFDDKGEIIFVREDVGRHNAFDKVVGAALLKNQLPLSKAIALVSGRLSFELVQKAVMAGIPVLAAIGAPSSLAVDLAREFGVTLLGFVRDERFNIYCGEERLNFDK